MTTITASGSPLEHAALEVVMPILIIGLVALAVFSGIGILLFTATAAEHHEREEHPDTAQGHRAA